MNSNANDLLRFKDVTIGYGRKRILEKLNFEIEAGDYLAIVGGNGSGKTTLLRTLLGLLPPISGEILIRGAEPRGPIRGTEPRGPEPEALRFGYVPQLNSLDEIFPLTALEIVVMGLYGRLGLVKRPTNAERDKAREAMTEVGIGHLEGRLFRELSGGQKQRALVARALVCEPDVLVLDEHTNNLDIAGEKSIMQLVDEVHAHHKMAVVMVTHSLNTVANHARHIGIINQGAFDFHTVDEIMQTEYLCRYYGVTVEVHNINGKRVVI